MWDVGDCPVLSHSTKYMRFSGNEAHSSITFSEGYSQTEIDTILNRLTISMHIIMCVYTYI